MPVDGGRRADLIVSGRIATLDGAPGLGPAWTGALAIAGGRVLATGHAADVTATCAGPRTRRLDLGSDVVAIPGLTDSHLHLEAAALAAGRVQLGGAESPRVLSQRVADVAARTADPDAWILGQGWAPDMLGRWPTIADLEVAAPGRRVALWAHDHHALLVSGRVLVEAGIGADTADPAGGVILRAPDGAPSGVLQERAATIVMRRLPPEDASLVATAVRAYAASLLAHGVVAVHDPGPLGPVAGLGPAIAAYRALAAAGDLPVRIHACIRADQVPNAVAEQLASGRPMGEDPLDRLRLGWLKLFADGSLGSGTAAVLEPMRRRPGDPPPAGRGLGVWATPPDALAAAATDAARHGISPMIHAIGDAAVRGALDVIAAVPRSGAPLLPRLEHVQLLHPDDLPRFAALGVAASVQPVHARTDAIAARALWGPAADERGYPYGVLAASGALIPFGSDAPVEEADPWPGIAMAVTRRGPGWPSTMSDFGPGQVMTLWRAIRAACVDPARTAGERDRGRLVAGARADLVVVPAAAFAEPLGAGGPALATCRPRLVLVDGEIVAGTDA